MGEKLRIQVTIAQLRSLVLKFKRKVKIGGSIRHRRNLRSDRVQWQDQVSAYKSRIRTGVITNLSHVDLRSFLNDAKFLVISRIRNIIRREANLKVNFILACKYENAKNNQTVEEIKSFTTQNSAILPATDLSTWFDTNITQML
uniref:Uncharacterized protein n=1 Tax=Bracon brevicornis TaxID=1563983 RepID=A0A6V7KNY6_9HYME